jgi:hypothetical protein
MDEAASAADEAEEEEAVLPLAAIAAYRQLQVDLNLELSDERTCACAAPHPVHRYIRVLILVPCAG